MTISELEKKHFIQRTVTYLNLAHSRCHPTVPFFPQLFYGVYTSAVRQHCQQFLGNVFRSVGCGAPAFQVFHARDNSLVVRPALIFLDFFGGEHGIFSGIVIDMRLNFQRRRSKLSNLVGFSKQSENLVEGILNGR